MPLFQGCNRLQRRFGMARGGFVADLVEQVRNLGKGGYDDDGPPVEAVPYDFHYAGDGGSVLNGGAAEFHDDHIVKFVRRQR